MGLRSSAPELPGGSTPPFSTCAHFLIAMALLAASVVVPAGELNGDAQEYQVKAAVIYRIAKFVEWPLSGLEGGEISLCVIGEDPFGTGLETIEGRFVHGRRLTPRRIDELSDLPACDIAFVTLGEEPRLEEICAVAQEHHVLTVADSAGFGERCVVVNLIPQGRRIGFELNYRAATRSRLRISSELLKLGTVLHGPRSPRRPRGSP